VGARGESIAPWRNGVVGAAAYLESAGGIPHPCGIMHPAGAVDSFMEKPFRQMQRIEFQAIGKPKDYNNS
jgi:hypothetical protein